MELNSRSFSPQPNTDTDIYVIVILDVKICSTQCIYLLILFIFQSLASAASILVNGAERMRKSQSELNVKQTHSDFHYELMNLRQKWRLKKVGNVILGDLSYKSCELKILNMQQIDVFSAIGWLTLYVAQCEFL